MTEKIVALVFGMLAFTLEMLVTVTKPSVESVAALVFSLVVVVSIARLVLKDMDEDNGRLGL